MGSNILDWMLDHTVPWLLILGIVILVLMVIVAPFAWYAESKAERFALRKDEWTCTQSHERALTTYVQSGSVMVPLTTYSKECDQWSKKP